MPPNQNSNQNKPVSIYPEATSGPAASVNNQPAAYVPPPTAPPARPRGKRFVKVLIPLLACLLIGGIAIFMWHDNQSAKHQAADTNKVQNGETGYYLPAETYNGKAIYKLSGYATGVANEKPTKLFITEYTDTAGNNFRLTQGITADTNICKTTKSYCSESYKTSGGHLVYPLKENGAYVEINSSTLHMDGLKISDATSKSTFDELVDSLTIVGTDKLAAYDKAQRQKPAWQKLYTLPYPIYAPATPPNSLPVKYQDVTINNGLYGSDAPYLSTVYTNKASTFAIDNTGSTYKFVVEQLQKPAAFKAATNCLVGTKKYTCTEMREVETSPVAKIAVDTSKYHLYKTGGGYITSTLIADFGKTVMVIDMFGPTNVFKEELGAYMVTSLNSMTEAKTIDLPLLSTRMSEGL